MRSYFLKLSATLGFLSLALTGFSQISLDVEGVLNDVTTYSNQPEPFKIAFEGHHFEITNYTISLFENGEFLLATEDVEEELLRISHDDRGYTGFLVNDSLAFDVSGNETDGVSFSPKDYEEGWHGAKNIDDSSFANYTKPLANLQTGL